MNGLVLFYSISGVLIVGLLIRIWFKNRAAKQAAQPIRPVAKVRPPVRNVAAAAVRTQPAAPEVAATSPVQPAASVANSTLDASSVSPRIEPASAVPSPVGVRPATYVPSASSGILKSTSVQSWEDRRLLEGTGAGTAAPKNSMPRVLAADIPGTDDSDRTFGSSLNPTFAALLPDTDQRREEARKELLAAGYYTPHALENLAAIRYVLMMLAVLIFGGLLLIAPPRLEPWAIAGLVAGPMVGWALPMLHVRRKAGERRHEISRAMPDLLDMLNMCVSQGLTVPDALKRILRDFRGIYPALSQELGIVTEQAQINDMHTALDAFGSRIDLPEVHSFTSLLVQTERMGTSISDALTTYSDTMRESLKQRADEKGNRATFRLLFPTVLCLMPAVYLFLLGPAVNEMSKFFYAGGRDSLNSGTSAIQRLNAQRGVNR